MIESEKKFRLDTSRISEGQSLGKITITPLSIIKKNLKLYQDIYKIILHNFPSQAQVQISL